MDYCISSSDMFLIDSGETFTSNASILRYLARAAPALGLYGNSIMDRTEVLHCYIVTKIITKCISCSLVSIPGINHTSCTNLIFNNIKFIRCTHPADLYDTSTLIKMCSHCIINKIFYIYLLQLKILDMYGCFKII